MDISGNNEPTELKSMLKVDKKKAEQKNLS